MKGSYENAVLAGGSRYVAALMANRAHFYKLCCAVTKHEHHHEVYDVSRPVDASDDTVKEFEEGPMLQRRYSFLLSLLLFLAGLFAVSQSGGFDVKRYFTLLAVLVGESWIPLLWILGAAGWGWVAEWLFFGKTGRELSIQILFGIGLQLLLDWVLSWTVGLNHGLAWGLNGVGLGLLAIQLGVEPQRLQRRERRGPRSWGLMLSALPTSLLLGACTIPPGILWPSEYGGYDVLEYHLQLPQEWMKLGRMEGLQHNVFSFLPNLVESGYLHLALYKGSAIEAGYAAQLFSSATAVLVAWIVGQTAVSLARRISPTSGVEDSRLAFAAGSIYLAVPWTLVTGSIAYNEQTMMALGAGVLYLAFGRKLEYSSPRGEFRKGAAIGFLCSLSILVKPSSALLITAPICFLWLFLDRPRIRTFGARLGGIISSLLPLMTLWMTRNYSWTGNPFFPMLTQWFGTGHWTSDQATRWVHAISSSLSLGKRIPMFLSQVHGIFHPQFGWILLPALALSIWSIIKRQIHQQSLTKLLGILLLQIFFWLGFTHLMSRFLLPVLLPMCVIIGLGLATLDRKTQTVAASILVIVLTFQGCCLFWNIRGGKAGLLIDGVTLMEYGFEPFRTLNQLPQGSKVYAEGFATPFYVKTALTYHTAWDTSLMGEAMVQGGERGARAWLRNQGYTHLLIDWYMLGLYYRPGGYGYDHRITVSSLTKLIQIGFQEVYTDPRKSLVILKISG